jgi:hypothetical protein
VKRKVSRRPPNPELGCRAKGKRNLENETFLEKLIVTQLTKKYA